MLTFPAWAMGGNSRISVSDSDSESISDIEEDCKQEDILALQNAFSKCKRFSEARKKTIIFEHEDTNIYIKHIL